jgi:hypothetical protein
MTRLALPLAALVAWIALVAFAVVAIGGGARSALAYVPRMVKHPLGNGHVLRATDKDRAFWSGWAFDARTGRQVAFSIQPDIAFVRERAAGGCTAAIAMNPLAEPETALVSLNGAPPATLHVDHPGNYVVPLEGAVVGGVNVLTFRLPGAAPVYERVRSIELDSLALDCSTDAENRARPPNLP